MPDRSPSQSPEEIRLSVGLASVDITPEIGVPLAGFGGRRRRVIPWDVPNRYPYATFLKPSTGILDPIRAKAMILKTGNDMLFFLSLDLVAVTAKIVGDIHARIKHLGFSENEIFISATHTHSGPGTLSRNQFWQAAASDKFQQQIYERFLDGVQTTIQRAHATLTEASLFAASFKTEDLQRNRRGRKGHFDSEANLLLAKSKKGQWLGGLVNLAIHGTALDAGNSQFSADVPGAIENALAKKLRAENAAPDAAEAVILFLNGAEGDVAPMRGGVEGMNKIGADFAQQAQPALKNLRPISPEWKAHSTEIHLGAAGVGARNCVDNDAWSWFVPGWYRLSLIKKMPQKTRIWNLRLGDMIFLTWPGEPTTAFGLEIKNLATTAGFKQAWILGLTNDYLAYFTTPSEYDEGGYEACGTLYGREGGSKILKAHKTMAGL